MVPAGNKANHLSSVNHTTKIVHYHHHHHNNPCKSEKVQFNKHNNVLLISLKY